MMLNRHQISGLFIRVSAHHVLPDLIIPPQCTAQFLHDRLMIRANSHLIELHYQSVPQPWQRSMIKLVNSQRLAVVQSVSRAGRPWLLALELRSARAQSRHFTSFSFIAKVHSPSQMKCRKPWPHSFGMDDCYSGEMAL